MKISFEAEVIQVQAKKAQSSDKVVRIVLETDNEKALALQSAIAEKSVKIIAEI